MKVLVTGASGLLGRAVHARFLEHHHQVKALAFTRADPQRSLEKLDLTDETALKACLDDFQPDVIIHTAAERRPDVVERDPQASNAINVDVPASLAQLAAHLPTVPLLVNISTDYVFDGSKPPYKVDDHANPLNSYGVSKLQGERAVAQHAKPGHFTNLRVPVLYGAAAANSESAVNVLLDAIQPRTDGSAVKCDAYAVRYPTCVDDVATALVRLSDVFAQQPADAKDIPPTTHFSAKEAMTKYDMCLVLSRVANAVGLETRTDHLDPEYEVDPLAATARPRHCKLDTSVLEGLGVPIDFVPFEEWWRPYLAEKLRAQREEEARLAAEAEARRLAAEEEERKRREAEEAEARRKAEEEEERLRKQKEEEEREAERLRLQREKEAAEAEEAERRRVREAEAEAEVERKRKADEEAASASAAAAAVEQADGAAQAADGDKPADDGEAAGTSEAAPADLTGSPSATAAAAAASTSRPTSPSAELADDPAGPDEPPRSSPLGSPNPSFSSLQARPTPPATSGLPSPSSSVPPSIRSVHRPSSPIDGSSSVDHQHQQQEQDGQTAALGTTPTASTTGLAGPGAGPGATTSGPAPIDSPLNLSAAGDDLRRRSSAAGGAHGSGSMLAERSMSGSSAGGPSRLASLTDEKNLFGGTVRALDIQGAGGKARAGEADGDNDSDGYGQPSPRTDHAVPGGFQRGTFGTAVGGAPAQAATAGGGFGVDSTHSIHSEPSTGAGRVSSEGSSSQQPHALPPAQQQPPAQVQPPPQLYHRSSFDAAQLERERQERERAARKRWEFGIRVGDPQKVGDPMTAHIVYTVRTTTDCPRFRASQFSALRRYKDFRWLHAALVQNNPGIIVPPVPEKVTIGRFAAELVEARRLGLETCINKIASHPVLQQDDDLRLFLESDNFGADVKARDAVKGAIVTPEQKTRKSWVPGVVAMSSSGATHKFHEFDEWFETQKVYLDSLEGCLRQVVKSISGVSNQRKELAGAVAEMANVLVTLGGSSLSRSVSTCFAGLAEVQKRAYEIEEQLAEADVRQLGTVMYEYERTVGSIRKAFATRLDVWQAWQRACDEQHKMQARYNKVRAGGSGVSSHHLSSLLSDVSEAEARALERERDFHVVSERCKSEMERLDLERVDDFRGALQAWLDGLVSRQQDVVDEWEAYLALVGRQMGLNPAASASASASVSVSEGEQQPSSSSS
ncbi:uncharacterized protein PFL1_05436 [Pseudozyma flocculosa PF-1]|uniref:Related to Vacuolar protein sorting-associated protein VPS5 n=2 Tax=Pseudozyma flocculosa TaxID=84751 RepID=A0A5C3FA23_9BASI|nr:uncharacterized protein PFL1_05436 [Pseudozyma flocculosa PF-1]EPQ27155.1 hypothetical protein PFL1_05436 [Pseudozyma flocculosa PF-1]SPO41264.1 related to Vacuolar protein sorting-associated protein VPS5 [Pseudozyma flocculosa]